jgi:hypothetical protein
MITVMRKARRKAQEGGEDHAQNADRHTGF